MHIPDNYLSPSTCFAMGVVMVPVLASATKKVKEEVSQAKMPLLGIGAAFSFMLMMFNIPLPGGTTGHAVGGTLLAILMGPYAACISITVALLIQALLFGDGGVLAFAANSFNMAFVMPFAGFFVYKLIRRKFPSKRGETIGIALGSYLGINFAALFAAIEFGVQPLLFISETGQPLYCPYPLSVSIPAMMIPHLLVAGLVEAGFTVAIFAFIRRVSPDMIYEGGKSMKAIYGLLAAFIFLSPLGIIAAGTAWGEWGADEIKDVFSGGKTLGYVPEGMSNGFNFNAPLPDYAFTGMPEAVGYIISALAGVALLIILFKIIGSFINIKAGKGIG